MGGRIPEQIRKDVIRKWLLGNNRDVIADESSIGNGTVTEIVRQYSLKDSEVDLMRQVATAIRDQQTNVLAFAKAMRLGNMLAELGLNEDQIESLVTTADVHCFKRGLELQEFFNIVGEVTSYASKFGILLKNLPDHMAQQKKCLEELETEIKDAEDTLSTALQHNEITIRDLENYKNDKPVLDGVVEIQENLAFITQERDQLRKDLTEERSERITKKYEWLVPEHELDDVNKDLINRRNSSPIGRDELYRLANQLFRQPSKHVDIIEILRERRMESNKRLEN